MKISDFDKIYCINLPKRTDRKSECDIIFSNNKLKVEYIEGIDGLTLNNTGFLKPGAAGCCLSHKKIYQNIKKEKSWEKVLILEDDVEFHPDFKNLFKEYYKYVPNDWQILFFGGNHASSPIQINKYIHRLTRTFTTHCYAVKRSAIEILLEQFSNENIFNLQADVHLSIIQQRIPCYGFRHHIAWQRPSWSDIEYFFATYEYLK